MSSRTLNGRESSSIETFQRSELELVALKELYQGKQAGKGSPLSPDDSNAVPAHRFAFAAVHQALNAGAADASFVESNIALWKEAGLNWEATASRVLQTKHDVSYEQLERLAIEGAYGRERLVATLRIKRSAGYGGGLCTAGSLEHVAFWADWDGSGRYVWLGTAATRVYDIAVKSAGGLVYSVGLALDLGRFCSVTEEPKIVRFRAVLSWGVPPSTVDPDALTTWGNHVDCSGAIVRGAQTAPRTPFPPAGSYLPLNRRSFATAEWYR